MRLFEDVSRVYEFSICFSGFRVLGLAFRVGFRVGAMAW